MWVKAWLLSSTCLYWKRSTCRWSIVAGRSAHAWSSHSFIYWSHFWAESCVTSVTLVWYSCHMLAHSFIEVPFNTGNQRKWDAIFVLVLFMSLFLWFPILPTINKTCTKSDSSNHNKMDLAYFMLSNFPELF